MAHRRGRPGDDQQSRAGYATTTAASAQDQTITLKATAASLACIPIPGQNLTGQEVPGDQCVFSEKPTRNEALYRHDAIYCTVATINDLVCTAAWMLLTV